MLSVVRSVIDKKKRKKKRYLKADGQWHISLVEWGWDKNMIFNYFL
jgi:hypothetical protein